MNLSRHNLLEDEVVTRVPLLLLTKFTLMLQRADAEKTQYSLVGKVGQGIYPQGSDKTHQPDDDRMRGLGTWRHTEGVPHACTARGGHSSRVKTHGRHNVLGPS